MGCEDAIGYGPEEHTAALFLDLIAQAAECARHDVLWSISIHVYNAKLQNYPSTWSEFSGVILPGSLSSAYEENVPWIDKLKHVIQEELVRQEIPTLGICFGHQLLAHSFYPYGEAAKIANDKEAPNDNEDINHTVGSGNEGPTQSLPSGYTSRAGRVSFRASQTGQNLLGKEVIDLYATHGDHVIKLPDTALSLGGDKIVPVHAAAYFSTTEQAQHARKRSKTPDETVTPYAITFQSHLEYATSQDVGLTRTLEMILVCSSCDSIKRFILSLSKIFLSFQDQMTKRGDIQDNLKPQIQQDARDSFADVKRDSIDTMVVSGKLLGWFPPS